MTQHKQNTIKVGVMPPLTGIVGIYGTEITRAAQVACQEINEAGGVLGKPLELIIEDDGSLPESAVVAAEKLVTQHHCVAIIGNLLSNSRISVAYRVAEPHCIPYLNFSFYEGSILSRYFFHFAALPNQQIDRMIPYMCEKFGPRMFFAGSNYEWPRGSIDAAKRALLKAGGTILGEEYTAIGVPVSDIDTLLDHVEVAAPDVFVPYFAGADQINLLTRFTERGLKKKMAVVMGHYDELMASKLSPAVREGFYSSNTYFMTVDTAANRDYLQRLAAQDGVSGIWPQGNGILTNFGEGTYLCVKAFAQAANAAGSVDSEALVDALNTIRVSGPQGTVQMDPVTQHATVNTYLSRCNANGVFEIIERFGALSPVMPERYSHQRVENRATLEEDIRLQARMLDQMSEGVMLIDSRVGKIVYANGGAERMFGYNKGEILGLPIYKINAPDVGDPTDTAAAIIEILHRTGSWQGNIQNIRKDGSTLWTFSSVSTFTHPVHGEVWMGVHKDISAQKRNEEQLRQSEERLSRVLDAVNDGVWDWNPQTHEDYLSPRWKAILGYRDEELRNVDSTFFELIHPDDQELTAAAVQRHFEHNEPYRVEIRMRHMDGSYRWILCRGEAIRDNDGKPVRMLGTTTDITDRKQAEEALRLNEKSYRLLFENMMAGVVIQDASGKVIEANPAACSILGLSMDQIMGRTAYDERWRLIKKDGTPQQPSDMPSEVALRTGHNVSNFLTGIFIPENEDYRWILINSTPVKDEKGKPISTTTIFLDITELKRTEEELRKHREHLEELVAERTTKLVESERQLRQAQEIARLGHWTANLQTGTLDWSDEIYRIFGRNPKTFKPSIENFFACVHPDDHALVRASEAEAARSGRHSVDHRIVLPDSTIRWVHEEAQMDRDDQGKQLRLTGTVQDITTRKQVEQELIEAKVIAERASKAKSEFLSRMSHELRTPMNAILGFTQVLETDKLGSEQIEFVGEIHRAGDHLLELINELLDMSRIEAGKLTTVLQPVAVKSVVTAACQIVQSLVAQKRLTLVNQCDERVMVLADQTRLKQILVNLLSNAAKYNRDGGRIQLACQLMGEDQIRIAVTDTGSGIPADKVARLFKPFERLGAEYSAIDGTGIGLALSHQLAGLMGGQLGVESKLGEGSTFWVDLPVVVTDTLTVKHSIKPEDALATDTHQINVLYIEDNAANLRVVEAMFRHQTTLRLLSATNGEFGLELAKRYVPDAILLDIHLPGMDGYAVLEAIKIDPKTKDIPVIALSADAMPIDIEKGMQAGFKHYLTKPLKMDELMKAIGSVTAGLRNNTPQSAAS